MKYLKTPAFLQRMLLLSWALYFTLVLASNITDGLRAAGAFSGDVAFASGNFGLMQQVTLIYATPGWIVTLLFMGVLAWEGLAAGLFWQAFRRFPGDGASIQAAYTAGILLAAAFLVMDELFIAYHTADLEKTHLLLLIAQAVTLLLTRDTTNM